MASESAHTTALRLLHFDDDLVVCSKPPGMSVHRGPRSARDERFVLQTLREQIDRYLFPVHRLDRNTSGVLAFALSAEMAAALQASLASEGSTKEYLVLARGATEVEFASTRPLTAENGTLQPARTDCLRLATFSRCSLLRARIATGRHHQIRRHLDHLAHQVIGDSTHGKGRINRWFRENYGLPRMFLHACRLSFAHPRSGEMLDLRDPLADDLRAFLLRLPDVDRALVERL